MVSPGDPTPADVLYFVGEHLLLEHPSGHTWQLCGVFSREACAKEACTTEDHFYAPLELDRFLPGDAVEWPELVYPLRVSVKPG